MKILLFVMISAILAMVLFSSVDCVEETINMFDLTPKKIKLTPDTYFEEAPESVCQGERKDVCPECCRKHGYHSQRARTSDPTSLFGISAKCQCLKDPKQELFDFADQ